MLNFPSLRMGDHLKLVEIDEPFAITLCRISIMEEVFVLMSRINLVDSREFSRFYNFVFFMCRENGQKSITVSRSILAWNLVLSGRFILLNQWCSFVEMVRRPDCRDIEDETHTVMQVDWPPFSQQTRVVPGKVFRFELNLKQCVAEQLVDFDVC